MAASCSARPLRRTIRTPRALAPPSSPPRRARLLRLAAMSALNEGLCVLGLEGCGHLVDRGIELPMD
jgi:hypothetical protein